MERCECGGESVKRGFRKTNLGKKQLYLCKKCGRKFTPNWPRMRFPEKTVMRAVKMYASGLSSSEVKARLEADGVEVSRWTIIKWHKRFG